MKTNAMGAVGPPVSLRPQTAFGCATDFMDNRFVYIVISPRMRGLAIGVNVSPEGRCNFQCLCCEVRRPEASVTPLLDLDVMTAELQKTIQLVRSGKIRELPDYREIASEVLQLRQVVLSGDGEPTLAPCFGEAVKRIVHVRARSSGFKLILPTNGSMLDARPFQDHLKFFTRDDEVWIKLDAGTQAYMSRINRGDACLEKVLNNILLIGRKRPVVIQSMFPLIQNLPPAEAEIEEYINRLMELKAGGAEISLVHIYSSARPATVGSGCGHLPLNNLSTLCHRIKAATGLKAEFF